MSQILIYYVPNDRWYCGIANTEIRWTFVEGSTLPHSPKVDRSKIESTTQNETGAKEAKASSPYYSLALYTIDVEEAADRAPTRSLRVLPTSRPFGTLQMQCRPVIRTFSLRAFNRGSSSKTSYCSHNLLRLSRSRTRGRWNSR